MRTKCHAAPLMGAATLAALLAAAPRAAQAQTTYGATDHAAGPADPHPNSTAKAAEFDAAASALGPETFVDFETSPVGPFSSLTPVPGLAITGADYLGNPLTINNTPALPATPALDGYNTTPGGAKYLRLQGDTVTFTFSSPIQALGANFTGIQPSFYSDTATFDDGTTHTYTAPASDKSSGGISFLGFTDAGKSIKSVTINAGAPPNGSDFIGIDDLRFVPASPVVAVAPEPSAVATLGVIALFVGGLLWKARKRRAAGA